MIPWRIALSTADEASVKDPILLVGSIEDNLVKAAHLGYDAIEIHMRENDPLDVNRILKTVEKTKVNISALVTGRLNNIGMCSLIDDRPYAEEAALKGLYRYIDRAHKLSTDLVIGWVKGKIPEGKPKAKYMYKLARNLSSLDDYADLHQVKLFIEVINRYETNIFNTCRETLDFITQHQFKQLYVHLDTFHMAIEEANAVEAIREASHYLGYIHFADNNRHFPGDGRLDFFEILRALEDINYQGYISVECLPIPEREVAASRALNNIKDLCEAL
jgi:sugar phosphate isomerase/epimerase